MTVTLITNLILIVLLMLMLWGVSVKLRDASIVDPFWGTGFVIVAWSSLIVHWPGTNRTWLLCLIVSIWGFRLSGYLLWRNWGKPEDSRYTEMRDRHGEKFWLVSLFTVFLLQGLLLWFISLPIQLTAIPNGDAPLGWLDALGVMIWMVGLAFESIGDWQLAKFRSIPDNEGKVLSSGLWRYTRHPNYFGDFCVWWGIYLVSINGGGGWAIGSPLLMSILLMNVSGVTLLEKDITDRRPKYKDYKRRTSAFFPWLPKQ